MKNPLTTLDKFEIYLNKCLTVFPWIASRQNGCSKTISYYDMVSSNHKVLPLGKHNWELLGIGKRWESVGIGNHWELAIGNRAGILGNREYLSTGIGNAHVGNRECRESTQGNRECVMQGIGNSQGNIGNRESPAM